ncbi:discoidin domain-containing protein, partial [Pseudoflavonifractor phocaeensis]|uniref:discoidin domain-containing protein n=4 Tax=Pseudoflavonifractor phocaeensis TaxID=1870988 RepID=UPI0019596636
MRSKLRRALSLFLAMAMAVSLLTLAGPAASAAESDGRTVLSFNNDWRFYPGDWPDAQDPALDDSQWLYVNTPHSTIQYTPEHYYQEDLGIFWYRRHFTMDPSMEGQELLLTFEGAMQEATVWLNGEELGVHQGGYTQFAFDISDKVDFHGENVLAVRLDTRPNAAFAPGKVNPDFQYFGGLYRDVYLTVTDLVHITDPISSGTVAGGGVFLTSPAVSKESATVNAKTEVENSSGSDAELTLRTEIIDADGSSVVAAAEDTQTVASGAKYSFSQDLTVAQPRLWSTDTPELYTVRTTLLMDGAVKDTVDTTYGIRKVEWKRDGCYINDEWVELVGVNLHSETYMLGNAQSNDAIFAEIKRLREYGFNFIRMSHYPHDPAFYEACDRYGVAVLDCLAGWQNFSNTDAFKNNTYEQMRDQIRVNRNHCSVVAWEPSLNESGYTAQWAQNMHDLVKEEYPEVGDSKAYTSGWTNWNIFDIGVGTPQADVVGDAARYGEKPVVVSEYGDWNFGGFDSTTRVTREPQHYSDAKGGDEGMLVQCDNIQSSFAFNRGQSWYGATAYWDYADYAGFDVDKLTFCGVVDVARIPKFGAYFFQSQTDPTVDLSKYGLDSGPMVFIANTWADDSPDQVRIFSNCDEVALYLDGTLIARQTPDTLMWAPHGDTDNPTGYPTADSGAYVSTENLAHPPFTFDLSAYTPGEGTLKAVAYLDGAPVAEFTRSAPGTPSQITLTAEDDNPLKLDGSSAKLVWVDVKDENGTVVNTADDTITFTTDGPGFVIGEKAVAVRGGQWAVWVRSTRGEGDITLTASADGLESCTITIPTQTVDGLPAVPTGGDADETGFVHPEPPEEPVNIFLNKAATASSVNRDGQSNAEKAEYANDGDESTKWCAAITDTSDNTLNGQHWWQADLGAVYTVEEMEIVFDMAGNYQFQVAVSDDPDFTGYDLSQHETLTETNGRATVTVGQEGRYVRIYLNCPASNIWPCLREVSGTGTSNNVALGKNASASSVQASSSAALAVDGDAATFWNSGKMSPAWFQVDLGAVYSVSQISLSFAWASPGDTGGIPIRHSFTLQSSLDGQSWTDIGSWSDRDQQDNTPNVTAAVDVSASARYLRVSDLWATKPDGTNQWAEIAEFVAIGKPMGDAVRLDYGAPASATSSADGSDPAYGNDGDPAKYWVPAADDPAPAWQFDAGGLYQISRVDLTWNTDTSHAYTIDLSTDGVHWTTAVDHMAGSEAALTTADTLTGLARYVRISLQSGTADGFWINSTGYVQSPALTVTAVTDPAGISAEVGVPFDALDLPETVEVTLDGDVSTALAVTWNADGYQAGQAGEQTITGALTAIPGVEVPDGMTAAVTVTLDGEAPHVHSMVKTEAVAATCTESGNSAYWYCEGCGKYFTDGEGVEEIDQADTVIPALDHDFAETWTSDETGHWHVCTRCGTADEILAHIPGPEATETEPQTCTECGYILVPATGHVEHTPSDVWSYDDLQHWHQCTGCAEKLDVADHVWTLQEETDTAKIYVCLCGATKTEEIPIVTYEVTFETNGGSSVDSQSVAENGTVAKPADPVHGSFTFNGWYADPACTTLYDFSAPVTGDLTLYAGWKMVGFEGSRPSSDAPDTPDVDEPDVEEPDVEEPDIDIGDDDTPLNPAPSFTDIPDGHWAGEAIDAVVAQGLFVGTSDTTFSPEMTTTRGMIMTVLARLDGADTAGSNPWYQKGMEWAVAQGVSDGTNPDALISREQLATMLYRYAGSPA